MSESVRNLFDVFLSATASVEEKKHALSGIKHAYADKAGLDLPAFLEVSKQVSQVSHIGVISDLLDTYAPSYKDVHPDKRDPSWSFFDDFSDEQQSADRLFFESILSGCLSQGYTLTTPLCECVAFSLVKHSGWFGEVGFAKRLRVFEKQYGAVPFELVLDYEDEDTRCFPDLFVIRWFMANVVLNGPAITAQLLTKVCERAESDAFFDLENFWVSYHQRLGTWFQSPFGRVALESKALLA